MKRAVVIIWTLVGALGFIIVILYTEKFIKSYFNQPEVEQPAAENLRDSILYHAEKEQLHTDSAKIHHEKWEQAWKIYIDTVNIKSAHWDTIRAKYKRDLREKIRRSAPGFGDSLRSAQTSNLSPAARK